MRESADWQLRAEERLQAAVARMSREGIRRARKRRRIGLSFRLVTTAEECEILQRVEAQFGDGDLERSPKL